MPVHDLASFEVCMVEMDHTTWFLPVHKAIKEIYTNFKTGEKHLRTCSNDLLLIHNFCVSSMFIGLHILDPIHPASLSQLLDTSQTLGSRVTHSCLNTESPCSLIAALLPFSISASSSAKSASSSPSSSSRSRLLLGSTRRDARDAILGSKLWDMSERTSGCGYTYSLLNDMVLGGPGLGVKVKTLFIYVMSQLIP
jgi:hypothetical protein